MTMVRRPARRAATASARPESATNRWMSGSANELSRQREGVAEIEEQRLLRLDHPAEQPGLHLVLHAADGGRADADGLGALEISRIVLRAQPLDAGGRHGIDVGRDL